uniref:Secreted protein n=1 Tax=Heliothis virescens TaxID=7102 RepID=A0A2A4JGC3_HELVI
MPVWWGARAVSMRVCCVTTVLAALALRSAAEPAPRRYPAEWRSGRELARSRPLHELFEEPAPGDAYAHHSPPPLPPGALHNERRRARTNKRTPHQLPSEIASQMMLRASRSNRPYDVPQIGAVNVVEIPNALSVLVFRTTGDNALSSTWYLCHTPTPTGANY